jgi:hypothetical protein
MRATMLTVCALLVLALFAHANPIELTNEQFFMSMAYPSKDTEKYKSTLILFYTDGCMSCKELKHSFRAAQKKIDSLGDAARRRLHLARLNVGVFPALGRREGIDGVPVLKLYSSTLDKPKIIKDDPSPEFMEELMESQFRALLKMEREDSEEREGL